MFQNDVRRRVTSFAWSKGSRSQMNDLEGGEGRGVDCRMEMLTHISRICSRNRVKLGKLVQHIR